MGRLMGGLINSFVLHMFQLFTSTHSYTSCCGLLYLNTDENVIIIMLHASSFKSLDSALSKLYDLLCQVNRAFAPPYPL